MEKIVSSGLIRVGGFPPTVPCPNLIIAYANNYYLDSQEIRASDGSMILRIDSVVVSHALKLVDYEEFVNVSATNGWGYF